MPAYDQVHWDGIVRRRLPGYVEAFGAYNPDRERIWELLRDLQLPTEEDGRATGLWIPMKTKQGAQNISSNIHSFQKQFGYKFSTRVYQSDDEDTKDEYPWMLFVWRREDD